MHTGYYWCTLHWLDVASTVDSRPTHTHIQARVEGGGTEVQRVELGGGVIVTMQDWVLDLSDISDGGKGGESSGQPHPAPPFLTPSLRGDVSTFPENHHGPEYVWDSSDKIYKRGHKTPFMRGGREKQDTELTCHTDQTALRVSE